jgi:outer membrane protein insertion porin family
MKIIKVREVNYSWGDLKSNVVNLSKGDRKGRPHVGKFLFTNSFILYLISFLLITSCEIKKHLPEGTLLYNGAKVNVEKVEDFKGKPKPIAKTLEAIAAPRKNKMILGFPYKVAMWYAIGAPKRESGLKNWLRNQLGEAPILSTKVDIKANETNMQAYLENKGHFRSTIVGKTDTQGYKLKVIYDAKVTRPYLFDTIKWVLDSSELSRTISRIRNRTAYVKQGDQFDIENIKAERNRVDLALKRRGFYFFNPDFIKAYVDTTNNKHTINVFYAIKKETPENARFPQTINAVTVFPNYTLLLPPPDTSKLDLFDYEGYSIRDTVKSYKPKTLVRPLTYQVGSLYNLNEHNNTLNRYINMGQFKFVKSRYESTNDSLGAKKMNVYYYLTPLKKKNFNAEVAGFTKSNSFNGGQININWKNRNLLRGAEQLNVKMYGAVETSSVDTLRSNNNFRVGTELSLTVPRFVTPFRLKESSYFLPVTKFLIGYEWIRRQQLYTKNFIRGQYDLNWKESAKKEHTLTPLSITYNNATRFSPEYLEKISKFPVLSYAILPEVIAGTTYNFSFNTNNPRENNIFFFNGLVDFAGNIAGIATKPKEAFSEKVAGAYFAQYFKSDVELRYSRKLATDIYWSNRLNIGIGLPYGNSSYLPFTRQFVIGGSNSLRGFVPRQLGPGRVLTTAEQQVAYPQIGGDYKLEVQTEVRFPLFSKLRGAFFVDAGNIWSKNSLIFGEDARLTRQFLKDIAVDGGIGVRLDISVLILRLDVGIPLRKPWLPRGSEWVIDQIHFGNSTWRKNNIVLNIGIGYPF